MLAMNDQERTDSTTLSVDSKKTRGGNNNNNKPKKKKLHLAGVHNETSSSSGSSHASSSSSSTSSSSASSSDHDDEDDYAAGLRAIREEAARRPSSGDGRSWSLSEHPNQQQQQQQQLLLQDDVGEDRASKSNFDDDASDSHAHHHHLHHHGIAPAPANDAAAAAAAAAAAPAPVPVPENALGTKTATALLNLLSGAYKKAPPSFFQPLLFTRVASHSYGLVQRHGGPCGAIAALQARVLVEWFFSGKSKQSPPNPTQALTGALAAIFEDIVSARNSSNGGGGKGDDSLVLLVPPVATAAKAVPFDSLPTQVAGLARCAVEEYSASTSASGTFPPHLVEAWMVSAWGLMCFVLSCVLTRVRGHPDGVSHLASDMDEGGRPLIVEHGYCSQELVNLMLCGVASSHVHDGVLHVDDHSDVALRGLSVPPLRASKISTKLSVGFLSMMEVRKFLTVGKLGKSPQHAVWVVYNESHFTVLFAKGQLHVGIDDAPSLTDEVAFDLWYYDPQCAEDEYRLTVTPSAMPLPARRANALISYVDQVLRTREPWANARVNWNGADPLL